MRATKGSEGTNYRMCCLKVLPEEKAFGSTYPLFTPPDLSWENKTGGIVTISYVILFSPKERSVKDASFQGLTNCCGLLEVSNGSDHCKTVQMTHESINTTRSNLSLSLPHAACILVLCLSVSVSSSLAPSPRVSQ